MRVVVCVVAVALLGAGQPPTAPQPSLPPLPAPTPAVAPPLLPPELPRTAPAQPLLQMQGAPARRLDFKLDPKATVKELLPPAPKVAAIPGPVLTDDLRKVPEIDFQALPVPAGKGDPANGMAHQIAKINQANAKKTDAFMAALLESRPDLAGMPFAMGDACRTTGDKLKHFTQAANTVRQALGNNGNRQIFNFTVGVFGDGGQLTAVQPANTVPQPAPPSAAPPVQMMAVGQPFWKTYATLCEQEDVGTRPADKETAEHVTVARVAALTQMLAVEPAELRLGLVKYLTGVPHAEATKALARVAIYSAEDDVRAAAVTALKVRREKDYTEVLVKGLRYPWPAVAKRAAEAIAKLERADLVPDLLAALDAADPRLPATKEVGGAKVAVVRELVKMNHHRNCLMCHAPAGSGTHNPNALTAEVAVQSQPLPLPSEGYRQSNPELMVRLDVTYLRQDFSAALPVADAHPWPEAQRFDFFVRERALTDAEAASYRAALTPKEEGVLSPYHRAAVTALRDLTGKDAAPTAEAWRKLLDPSRRD